MPKFTDAEQRFADSPEGVSKVAHARMKFEMGERWKGADAIPWTDAMEANAVRNLTMVAARGAVQRAAMMADCARREPIARAEAKAARDQMIANLNAPR